MTEASPKPVVIKVTDKTTAYFVHFDAVSHELIEVFEYKRIYSPKMGQPAPRTKIIIDLAHSRIGIPLTEENSGEHP